MKATTKGSGDIRLTGNEAIQTFSLLQSTSAFDGSWGVSNFFHYFEISMLESGGGGGGGNMEIAVENYHQQWGVQAKSYGGSGGFNNIISRIEKAGGRKMEYGSNEFYDLTAAETVRELVFNCNYEDALGTISSAYKDVFLNPGNGYSFQRIVSEENGTFSTYASQTPSNKSIGMIFRKTPFEDFAFSQKKDFNTFGMLVRSLYHEYIHGWDFSGSNYLGTNSRFILSTQDALAQFRAMYLSTLSNVRLPSFTTKVLSATYKVAMSFYNGFINDASINANDRNMYLNWYNTMYKFVYNK